MSKQSIYEYNMAALTPEGRKAMRRWYRFHRKYGGDRHEARRVVENMAHAVWMARNGSW